MNGYYILQLKTACYHNNHIILIVFDYILIYLIKVYFKYFIQSLHMHIYCFDYSIFMHWVVSYFHNLFLFIYLVLIFWVIPTWISYTNIIQSKSISKIINIIMRNRMIANFYDIALFLFLNKPIESKNQQTCRKLYTTC